MFNISTFEAMQQDLDPTEARRRPWLTWRRRDLSWSVAVLNLVGSVAFAISAIGAYVVPSTGELRSLELDNLGTFVGSLCFLAGAVLLIPDQAESQVASP
jgi:hypothetical protein